MLDGDVIFVFLLAVCCAQATVTPAFIGNKFDSIGEVSFAGKSWQTFTGEFVAVLTFDPCSMACSQLCASRRRLLKIYSVLVLVVEPASLLPRQLPLIKSPREEICLSAPGVTVALFFPAELEVQGCS